MYASTLASGTAPTSASATFSPAYNSKSPTAQFSHVSRQTLQLAVPINQLHLKSDSQFFGLHTMPVTW
jgi:hypothetical protein